MMMEGDSRVVPSNYSRIDPWVISRDTGAEIEFMRRAFGAQERPGSRMLNPDGTIVHVEVELADSVVMMFDTQPGWPDLPAHLRVYVEDAEATVDNAVAAGARVVTRPTLLAFGERVARVRDPHGHLWWVHERVEELDLEEMARRFAEPSFQQDMAYVQESLSDELKGDNR
jgi:PhnB protein